MPSLTAFIRANVEPILEIVALRVDLQSSPAESTTFTMRLPASNG